MPHCGVGVSLEFGEEEGSLMLSLFKNLWKGNVLHACFDCFRVRSGYWLFAQSCKLWTCLASLGKLEEEFERKFNSLPQYSPMTFDKKGTAVAKKKKPDSPVVQEEVPKAGKGKNEIRDIFQLKKAITVL